MEIFCFWHVNAFALISGIVGYNSNKYSNLLYLWIIVSFYSCGIYCIFKLFKPQWIINANILYEIFPVIYRRYWYFTAYFGMYLFLPIINTGILYLNKKDLKILVISTISIYVIWKDLLIPQIDIFKMNDGRSVIWLLIFYITGAYIGKYKFICLRDTKLYFHLSCILIFIISSLLCYFISNCKLYQEKRYYKIKILILLKNIFKLKIDSLPMILQSLSITFFLTSINYNKYIGKIISFYGRLTFGVYIIHDNWIIRHNIIRNIFNKYSMNISLQFVIILIIINGIAIFIFAIFIEYLRNIIFNLLRIRKLCVCVDKIVYKLFS